MLLFHKDYVFLKIDILLENSSHHSGTSRSQSSEDQDIKLELKRVLKKRLVMWLLQLLSDSSIHKKWVSTSLFTSSLFIQELLDGSSSICYVLMWMENHGFVSLCHVSRKRMVCWL